MKPRPPRSTRTYTLFPYTTLCRSLGSKRQVMSVTHLAQVAAQGHAHFAIHKQVQKQQTYTRVSALKTDERVTELARMQGGVEVGPAALEHARDLLQRAAQAG